MLLDSALPDDELRYTIFKEIPPPLLTQAGTAQ
jgi:hypothetical protein